MSTCETCCDIIVSWQDAETELDAEALTEAQRDKLLYGYFPMVGWPNVSVNGAPTHISELVAAGLLERSTGLDGKPHPLAFHATPLGLAVREHLLKRGGRS